MGHQPIPAEVACEEKSETAFQQHQRLTMEILKGNMSNLKQMIKDKDGYSKLECFKCCRMFVYQNGLDRHFDRHIGELVDPSPVEEVDKFQFVVLCVFCSEVFWKDSDAWNHLKECHINVVDDVKSLKTPEIAVLANHYEKNQVDSRTGEVKKKFKLTKFHTVFF